MSMDSDRGRCVQSRRGLLQRLAAVPLAGTVIAAVPQTATAANDPADEAFRYWIKNVGDYNAGRRPPNEDENDPDCPVWEAFIAGPERRIYLLPPSVMAAGAIALVEVSYDFDIADKELFEDASIKILQCLAPGLHGIVGLVARDLLHRLGDPYPTSLLARGQRGREVMPWAA